NAPLNSRAVIASSCSSGYRNPDTGACVNRGDVRWVQGTGLPNATTVGRNTLRSGGINNLDLTLTKSFRIAERTRLDFRWEAINALNHPQFTQVPNSQAGAPMNRSVVEAPSPQPGQPSRFLNPDFTNSGIRSMWGQLKLVF